MTLEELAKEPSKDQREDPCRVGMARCGVPHQVVERGGGQVRAIDVDGMTLYKWVDSDNHLGAVGGE